MTKINKIIVFVLIISLCFNFSIFSEDNPNAIIGDWFYITDVLNKGDSKVIINGKEKSAFQFYPETIDGKEVQVALLSGYVTTKFPYGFLGMGLKPKTEIAAKLKQAKGIKFKTMGDGKQYRVKIEISSIKDYDHYGKVFKATATPTEVVVLYSQLSQEGWGQKMAFNAKFAEQISFQTIGQPHKSILLKIWDLQLVY